MGDDRETMTQKSPPLHPSISDPDRAARASPPEEGGESEAVEKAATAQDEAADPYDDLWDPDMDTRPERIRKTKARPRVDSRGKSGTPPRGKRREGM